MSNNVNYTEQGKRQVLHSAMETRDRLLRRLETLRIRLFDMQQEVDDLVAVLAALDFMLAELRK